MTMMSMMREGEVECRHLGDGVYASFDGLNVWLRTPREVTHEIALDAHTFEALIKYVEELRLKKHS